MAYGKHDGLGTTWLGLVQTSGLAASLCALGCSSSKPTVEVQITHTHIEAGAPDAAPARDADAAIQSGTLIQIADGKVQGATANGVRHFLGIPYAKPPVGALRWKPPQKPDVWTDVKDATNYGNECAQPKWVQGPESDTEDCLYLNVWTPDPAPSAALPVMLWLPGGGNQNGGASDDSPLVGGAKLYDGTSLSKHGVVVVTINYRLGAFGFFSHPGLTKEGSNSGNQGLLDQQAALAWVRDNIGAFDGDARNVTLWGESAGAQDTCLQVVSPGSKGLFGRAISESGGCTTYRKLKATAESQATAFAAALGCSGASDELACLRGKSAAELFLAAPVDGAPEGGANLPGGTDFEGGAPRWDFNPVVDGTVIPDQPRTLVESDQFAKVPYIMGSNFEEGKLFLLSAPPAMNDADYTGALDRLFGANGAKVAAAYPSSAFPTPNDALIRVWGDYRLGCPTYESAQRFQKHGADARMYVFSRVLPGGIGALLGATHGTEMPYVFGTLPMPPADDATLIDEFEGYWTRFANAGDPNGGSALAWPAFDDQNQRMGFDVPLTVVTGYRQTECAFWATLYDAAFN